MIKARNLGEVLLEFDKAGAAANGSLRSYVAPFPCQLKALYSLVRTAGVTGGPMEVDVQKNGTSIFSSAQKIEYATGVATPVYGPLTTDPVQLAKGDILTLVISGTHTTPAVDLSGLLVLQRLRGDGPVNKTVTAGIGPEAE